MYRLFLGFILFCRSVCLSFYQHHAVLGDHSFRVSLEIRECKSSEFFRMVLIILVPLHFHIYLGTSLLTYTNNSGMLTGIGLN